MHFYKTPKFSMSYYCSKSNVHNLIDKSAEPVAIFAYEFGDRVNDDYG
jgi:hypothetical protein